MAMNRIQFQPGMSVSEFPGRFGTEQQRAEAVMATRWPRGFCGFGCGETAHCVISVNLRPLFQCGVAGGRPPPQLVSMFAGTKLLLNDPHGLGSERQVSLQSRSAKYGRIAALSSFTRSYQL